ncbi:hypothetical protein ABID82_003225 [Methylobacterium sp. PvP062]|uniref:Exosortase/archaeosortase family protein n=1 Tax=Methylobacterium radiotolerans TaxID=31998 RepID=A0ABV2NBZ9_9HYPH|nr:MULTISPECIES: hypothetical protein [unclassified Methylobacterium]MBP2492740.1 hypothetical protein [Methylobacterium sp. PvP105]MBP2500888.1 hypothetical protein [Methylobacterium sp. PvP109]
MKAQTSSQSGFVAVTGRELASLFAMPAASWAMLVFACGTALSAALQRLLLEHDPGTQRLIELDLGEMFATVAVVALVLFSRKTRSALQPIDLAFLCVCALPWLLPEAHAVYAGMTIVALWLIARRAHDRLLVEVGQVWLALSLCELWSKLAFKLFYPLIAPAEVAFMAWVGRSAIPGLYASGLYLSGRPGWSIVMLEGCSAFHNLSLAALIWLCVLRIAGRRATRGAAAALAASAALVVAINVARILAMLPSQEAYSFWHDGIGSVIVALAAATASVLPIVVVVERAVGSEPCSAPPKA